MPDNEFDSSGGISDQQLYGALGRVSALESEAPTSPVPTPLDSLQTPLSQRYKPGLYGAYWEAVSMQGVALPGVGTDWSPAFGDPSATLVHYQIPSTSGELWMNGDATDCRFAQAAVFCNNSFTITGKIKMSTAATSPRVQIWCNGLLQEFIASSTFSITLRGDGQTNLLKVITNFSVGELEVRWTLWDGDTCFWVDPRTHADDVPDPGSDYGTGTGTSAPQGFLAPVNPASLTPATTGQYNSVDDLQNYELFAIVPDTPDTVVGDGLHVAQITYASADMRLIGVSSVAITRAGIDTEALHTGDAALIKSTVSLTGQVADIADTAFGGANVAGLYRIEVYLLDTTADVTAGAVTAHIKYTDGAASRDQTAGPVALTATTAFAQATFFVQLASGSITYGVTHTGLFGTAAYAFYATCERIA